MIEKTCTSIGGQEIPSEKIEDVTRKVREAVDHAVEEGYTYFILGFTGIADMIFASVLYERQKENEKIRLEAAVEYRSRLFELLDNEDIKPIFLRCDGIGVYSETEDEHSRARLYDFMVRNSNMVMAMCGEAGGPETARSIRSAYDRGKTVRIVEI